MIFGTLSFVINVTIYFIGIEYLRLYYLTANILAWIISVIFSFVSNKIFVFRNHSWEWTEWIKQSILFLGARLMTGGIDMLGMFLMVELICANPVLSKIIINVIVIIINYILSKLFIFKKDRL